MIHNNSIEAYKQIMFSGSKGGRAQSILKVLDASTVPLADYEVLAALFPHSGDMNKVRPRLSELHQAGILEEGPPVKSHEGKTNVRTSRICEGVVDRQMSLL